MLSIIINFLLAIHVIVALLLILVVLMQRPKNEGLGAAFGGGMTDNLFGAQTTNVLQTFTRNLGILFFVLAVTLSVLYAKQSGTVSEVDRKLMTAPKPAAEAAPTPAAESEAASGEAPVVEEEMAVEVETEASPAAESPASEPAGTPAAEPAPAATATTGESPADTQ